MENGAERRPPPGIQAQRPTPAHRTHRTHDTTDQWREIVWWLGRSEADFPAHLPFHEKYVPSRGRVVDVISFILAENYTGFLQDQLQDQLS